MVNWQATVLLFWCSSRTWLIIKIQYSLAAVVELQNSIIWLIGKLQYFCFDAVSQLVSTFCFITTVTKQAFSPILEYRFHRLGSAQAWSFSDCRRSEGNIFFLNLFNWTPLGSISFNLQCKVTFHGELDALSENNLNHYPIVKLKGILSI